MKLKEIRGMLRDLITNTCYFRAYYKKPIREKYILIESKNGSDLAGNMFQILLELTGPEYSEYSIWLAYSAKKKDAVLERPKQYGIQGIHPVRIRSRRYFCLLATAKYLFTDTSFLRNYVKREGQTITNTWHGTPMKYMGVDVTDRIYAMGNVQRNLLYADYLVYPNDFMKEIMVNAYLLNNLYRGTILCEGYPRNSCFFDPDCGKNIRSELELEGKQVSVYMPTWRGTLTNKASDQLLLMLEYFFIPLDRMMQDNQILYIKLHPFVNKQLNLCGYKHILPFPNRYDTYEFLNICDILITDYSSVFFDFANTRKKIILFAYDETQYRRERGMYIQPSELPFPTVRTSEQLFREMCCPKNYDDTDFLKKCCTYDAAGAAERICRHVVKGIPSCKEEKVIPNGKKNVLIYASFVAKNGMTTALFSLLKSLDKNERNYYISFQEASAKKDPMSVRQLPEGIGFLPISSDLDPTFMEMLCCHEYFKGRTGHASAKRYKDRLYEREFSKHFGGAALDCVIEYTGYGIKMVSLFEAFRGKRVIFVHNNMVEELRSKENQNRVALASAYRNYDCVAVVSEDMMTPTVEIGGRRDNIVTVNNCHAYQEVLEKSEAPVFFDKETTSNVSLASLKARLEGNKIRFITIGRFSAEKGHKMLISAFERFSAEHPESCLIIIGGYGTLYWEIRGLAQKSTADIVVIRTMKNPMPVLKQCDFFLLSSYHEGLGLVLLEADTLGIPVVSTDIPGPQGFMQKYGGMLVPPDENGMYQAMQACIEGKVKPLNVDYEEYNRYAVEQFEQMLNGLLQ